MFIGSYTNYIQPITQTQPKSLKPSSSEKKSTTFELPKEQKSIHAFEPQTPFIDKKALTNYYANRYKLFNPSPYENPSYQKFQQKSHQVELPKAYRTSFTTFYDIFAPKSALSASFTPNSSLPKEYKESALKKEAKEAIRAYQENSRYFEALQSYKAA